MDKKIVMNESEFKEWFKHNFEVFGYSKIIKDNKGKFPDFIMLKESIQIGVELETLSSNFILHKHDSKKVDEVICIEKDVDLNVPLKIATSVEFQPQTRRISATIEPELKRFLNKIVAEKKFRNKSHAIEYAVKLLTEQEAKNDKK